MSLTDQASTSALLGVVATASILGAAIAYLTNQPQEPEPVVEKPPQRKQSMNTVADLKLFKDKSEGKRVGQEVSCLQRKKTGVIEQDDDFIDPYEGDGQDINQNYIKKLLDAELAKQSTKQKKITNDILKLASPIIDRCPHLVDLYGLEQKFKQSPLIGDNAKRSIFGGAGFLPRDSFMPDDAFVIAQCNQQNMKEVLTSLKFLKSGPRELVYFDPKEVRAAIVTCGGLCPGLNVVIREIVMSLHFNYEAKEIWGIKWGYKGFYTDEDYWVPLTPSIVKNIHKQGGTILGSSRGGFDADKILDSLELRGINQVYIIGGDGTHRGINALMQRAIERRVVVSFVGIPKTIDNDIPLIDHSFGFNTSCEVASKMIEAAYTEATNAQWGVGLVKLMGRYSGFIARNASLANGNVDICLVPELPFELGGPRGLYESIIQRLKEQKYCVVVVAEGAEEGLINPQEKITKIEKRDDSNNLIYDDIGKFLKEAIVQYAKKEHNLTITLKYIDPTYAIRSVASNAVDTIMCAKLAQNGVHGAMAGYTGFSVGVVRNAVAMIPVTTLIKAGVNNICLYDRTWQRLMSQCRQRSMVNNENEELARKKILDKRNVKIDVYRKIVNEVREIYGQQVSSDKLLEGPLKIEPEIDNV